MKTSIQRGDIKMLPADESVTERHLKKMGALLKTYDPDLVQFRGTFKKQARRTAFVFEATLSLPTGTLHATGEGPAPGAAARQGFAELESQIKRHQALLRKDYQWKRKRGSRARRLA
jgi:ribosome-associated translation inhibitor RaiA